MTASGTNPILAIRNYGQSIWIDNLSRDAIVSGELKELISSRDVRGITSNPAIFEKAIAGNKIYDADIAAGARESKSVLEIYESLVFEDIRNACDIFKSVYEESGGLDGYVSIEVPPNLARDTAGTIAEAQRYYQEIDRPNVMIKIPGTPEGLLAVEKVIAAGINVNVTLLFSVASYVETFWAYIRGLEARMAKGEDVSQIASVASFFISRIDSNIDALADKLIAKTNDPDRKASLDLIKGQVAIANAKIAYQEYKQILQSDRWQALAAKGARPQRLLWASTSTKNPLYKDTIYIEELIGPDTVNTVPPSTIEACADHCDIQSRIETNVEAAYQLIASLKELGIDIDEVMAELLEDGIDKFIKPFDSLIASLQEKVNQLVPA
ncbi:MAG TPA: transaldolase [Oscillatoriaceae cyanobacterium M33_DOE_052]|uniref:Transaldolase n=1 Tax=Planktothricoides sp. SpSt-374 TaxID=2282167 RepID=A0A7C3VR67_9CYAN|nr:transaldolase [Oscillatoriaceae cyanobacterium M33_DOE_052]